MKRSRVATLKSGHEEIESDHFEKWSGVVGRVATLKSGLESGHIEEITLKSGRSSRESGHVEEWPGEWPH